MRCHPAFLILALGVLPLSAFGQGNATRPAAKPAATAATPEILKKLFELGYPAAGESSELGISQWRARTGRRTIGPLNAEEAAAIQREAMPAAFGAYLGDPFRGYGVADRQKSRAEAAAVALDQCRKNGGPTCEAGRQITFTGQRCIALAGYKEQIGADGKAYTAFSPFVGDTAEAASATAVRNCASDADGKKHCKPLFVHCADGSTVAAAPAATPTSQPTAAPAPQPTVPPPPSLPNMADIANRLFTLGFPVSGKATDDPAAAISQWRFRLTGKPSRDPLTPDEIRTIMSTPRPAVYGAFAGTTFSGFGLASQIATREQAENEAITRCQQAKGPECEKTRPMVVADTRCIAYAGYSGALKADGKAHTLSASGIAEDPASASKIAMSRCSQEPDNAPFCKPHVVVCADGRQLPQTTVSAPPAPASPPATPAPTVAPAASPTSPAPVSAGGPAAGLPAGRPSADVMNKLFALGYPFTGKPYGDPAIAIAQWRAQEQRAETGGLTAAETSAILGAPVPRIFVGFAGDPLGLHGLATQRDTRAKAEVDAVASCRQKRGNCDDDAYVAPQGRCLAFAGFKDETSAKPRTVIVARVAADTAAAAAQAMARCVETPANSALCKPILAVCGDAQTP